MLYQARDSDFTVVCRVCWSRQSLIQGEVIERDDESRYVCKGADCGVVVVLLRRPPISVESLPDSQRPYTHDGWDIWSSTVLRFKPPGREGEIRIIAAPPPVDVA